jgi:glutaredoxin-like protein NrdH
MIIVHTQPRCMPCLAVKRWLAKRGFAYREEPITPESAARFRALGILESPVVELPGEPPHGGFRAPLLEAYAARLASPPEAV